MSDVNIAAKTDLSKDDVIRQKTQAIPSGISRDGIAALEFDIIYGICQATRAWETTSGEVAGLAMDKYKRDYFWEKLNAVNLMRKTGKSRHKYTDLAKLCHPACECLLNEYDGEKKTFHQFDHYGTIATGAWSGIWRVAEVVAREGGEVNTAKRLEVAKEGFRLCTYLVNAGYASPKEEVKGRCLSFMEKVANSKYYKEAESYINFDELVSASEKFRYIGKAFTNCVSSSYRRLENLVDEINKLESAKDLIEKKIEALKAEKQRLLNRSYA